MRLAIIGVGQMVDFETGDMINQLQVQDDSGQVHMIATDEDTVQELIKIVAGVKTKRVQDLPPMSGGPEYTQEYGVYEQSGTIDRSDVRESTARDSRRTEDLPEGAEVFGGRPMDSPLEEDEAQAQVDDPVALRNRARKSRRKVKITEMAQAQVDDRSGVPTRTLPADLVDEKGNPMVLGGLPDSSMDDEEDPGEIGQI
jgi:hypothetical protein